MSTGIQNVLLQEVICSFQLKNGMVWYKNMVWGSLIEYKKRGKT